MKVNGRDEGEVRAVIESTSAGEAVQSLVTESLVKKLQGRLVEGRLSILRNLGEQVSFERLRSIGIPVTFDEAAIEVRIDIPVEDRPWSDVRVSAAPSDSGARLIESQPFSASINPAIRFTPGGTRNPILGEISTGTYLEGWSLESQQSFRPQWRADRWEIQRDFEGAAIRVRLGQLNLPAVRQFPSLLSLNTTPPDSLLGVSISQETSLRPLEIYSATGRIQLRLDRPSKVKIWMQDQLIATLSLDSGVHELTDFPAIEGYQEALIEVRDDLGNTRYLTTRYIHSPRLLKLGKTQFLAAAGPKGNSIGWIRAGVLPSWTVGLGASQFSASRALWAESTWGFRWGFLESTLSRDWSTNSTITSTSQALTLLSGNLIMGWEKAISVGGPPSPDSGIASLFTAIPIGNQAFLGARTTWCPSTDRKSIQGSAGLGWSGGWNARSSYESSSREWLVSVGFQPTFSTEHRLQASYSTRNDTRTFQWTKGTPRTVPNAEWDGRWEKSQLGEQTSWNTQFFGNRGLWGFDLVHFTPSQDTGRLSAALYASTGFGYAGGRFGWGRPVQKEFVIIDQRRRKDAKEFQVNPRSDGSADAWWSPLAPALLPRVTPYRSTEVTIRGAKREEVFSVKPRSAQGTLVVLGDDAGLQIHGTAILSNGKPAAFATGSIQNPQNTFSENFFTNAVGEFWVPVQQPGDYAMRIDDPEQGTVPTATLTVVDPGENEVLEIGEIQLHE